MLVKLIDVRPAEFDASNQFLGNHRSHQTRRRACTCGTHVRTAIRAFRLLRAPRRIKIRSCRIESRVRGKCIRPILAARKPLFLARLCDPINVQKPRRRYECSEWRRGGLGFRVSSISPFSYQRDSFATVCSMVWHGAPMIPWRFRYSAIFRACRLARKNDVALRYIPYRI